MSGVPIRRAQVRGLYARRACSPAIGGLFLTFFTYSGEAVGCQRQHLHAVFDRRRGAGRRVAVRRLGQRDRRDLRRVRVPHHRRPAVRVRPRAAVAAAVPGRGAAAGGLPRRASAVCRSATGSICSDEAMATDEAKPATRPMMFLTRRLDPAVAIAFGCIIAAAAARQPLFAQLPVAGISAAAAEGRVVPRRHRHRHDAGHPARPDRPVGALGGGGRRHDGDARPRAAGRSATRWRFRSASSAASRSASSTASASPICASRR